MSEAARIAKYTPMGVQITGSDGRALLAIHADGTVEGAIEDAGEAARQFLKALRFNLAGVFSVPDRDDIARSIALVDSLIDPPLSGKYGRYADAVMAVLVTQPAESTLPVAHQYAVDRHAEKQGVPYADAWRYFEREGYDMSEVDGQYRDLR